MPEPLRIPTLSGNHDDPPATSTPATRRQRLRRAILGTNELAHEVIGMANEQRQGRSTVGGLRRRRPRSSSEHDESTSPADGEEAPRQRSRKRRRLDTKPASFKYGHYGQVEPGKLKMELCSCTGGQHYDHRHPATSLEPANVLRHDKSVYCSELSRVCMVLKHADETPFCLEKLHVIGPEMGFTAPVRAGIAYVAMTMKDLQKYVDPDYYDSNRPRHARLSPHNPRYDRLSRQTREVERSQSPPELLTVAEALQDPYINGARPRTPVVVSDRDQEPYCELLAEWDGGVGTLVRSGQAQPVTIITDEDAGPEDSSPQEVLDYRSQRERMMRRRYDIENWHRTREAGARADDSYNEFTIEAARARVRDREREAIARLPLSRLVAQAQEASNEELEGAMRDLREEAARVGEASRAVRAADLDSGGDTTPRPSRRAARPRVDQVQEFPATTEDDLAHYAHLRALPDKYCRTTGEPLSADQGEHAHSGPDAAPDDGVTIAPFRLRRDQYKVAMRFDPPVSGRFVMLKLWASDDGGDAGWNERREWDGNVDVQSVVCKGWMGALRFFPAVEMK